MVPAPRSVPPYSDGVTSVALIAFVGVYGVACNPSSKAGKILFVGIPGIRQ